uniref:G-protein coupled receptors family 3 profile domain-containing protein n=1 Tax=Neogobius melanostomus TaxID=47308 RepID=A0A8C6TGU8_9GOBI
SLIFLNALICTVADHEFSQAGDFLIGGLFEVHDMTEVTPEAITPEAIDCSTQPFIVANYRRLQLMRFAVEQINNSTQLLPGVTLGYEIFDLCSDTRSFPGILDFISVNESVRPWHQLQPLPGNMTSKVISVIGTYSSTKTRTLAPILTMDFIPLVNYGSSSSAFSEKVKYPSIMRTVLPNQQMIEAMVTILLHFRWHWVAFLFDNGEYSTDGADLFLKKIKDTEICLAYSDEVNANTNFSEMFQKIDTQKINVVIIFAPGRTASMVIQAAINLKISKKVWMATDAWAFNRKLLEMSKIDSIGTVIGIIQPESEIPGFHDFLYSLQNISGQGEERVCSQMCNCRQLTTEEIVAADPAYSFPVYSAVYVVAHALHNLLQCESGQCNTSTTVYPYMVLAELKTSNFTLLNKTIKFDENGDPEFGFYSIVFWNNEEAEEVGFFKMYPFVDYYINSTKIQWYTNGKVPTSLCSQDCPVGSAKLQNGIHTCCFDCIVCLNGTYINTTADPYTCVNCFATEWSTTASTSCRPRSVEFISFEDTAAMVTLFGTVGFVVVRSAGGPMCFLILGCLCLCSVSVFFYFGKPQEAFCILRLLPFVLFYTVCLACFVVRSFQIVSIFKIGAKYPSVQRWWMKYHGQWLVIAVAFILQVLLMLISYTSVPPKLYNETVLYPEQIVLACDINRAAVIGSLILCATLCLLCFVFSYMGKELPKNYNEAKAITFCLLLLALTWVIFATIFILYRGKHLQTLNALAVLSSLYSFLLWYFLPKCCIILFQPEKNTPQYFQGLIQSYTKTISQ